MFSEGLEVCLLYCTRIKGIMEVGGLYMYCKLVKIILVRNSRTQNRNIAWLLNIMSPLYSLIRGSRSYDVSTDWETTSHLYTPRMY